MRKLKVFGLGLLMFTMVAGIASADTMVMAYASAGKQAQSEQHINGQNKMGRIQINASGSAYGYYTKHCGTAELGEFLTVPSDGGTVSRDFYMSSNCTYSVVVGSDSSFPAVGRLYDYIP
ncbi:hypothetical protein [Paenibacillus sp. 1001270B_150601_E10]|uniref:hypothetical protein n=1 Tax=Paenibacillus sp. 1001270B_150601_E10 TaxID=2787079 RepID=UPI00189FDA13|nr:hypothetical protein [Paenibacillus sp. 1001270B_150601_E10]